MMISKNWLQTYFEKPLPASATIADAFIFHGFEVDTTLEKDGDTVFDVKVLPNRAGDCLSHRGLAKELSAILNIPMSHDSLLSSAPSFSKTDKLTVIVDSAYVLRHMGALVHGVKVGPSPEWLRSALEAVGQRSINNIVDATNYVMLDIGQPMHAFDAGKIETKNGCIAITIRKAHTGESIAILTDEEYILPENSFVIADAISGRALDIAGIKGGKVSGISDTTIDLFISVGNYDGTLIRKASQKLKIFTDAVQRYQNRPSPELTAYGMRDILALIQKVAGGEVVGVVDVYPSPALKHAPVSVSLSRIGEVLGVQFSKEEVQDVFRRLGFQQNCQGDIFTIVPPFERSDIVVAEDLCEEVGRILGYDRVPPLQLTVDSTPVNQGMFRGIEKVKDFLVERGFTEISTQSFAKKGEVILANPLDKTRPALRASLSENMSDALKRATEYASLVLPPKQKVKLFEVGTVFTKDGERLVVETSEPVLDMLSIEADATYMPKQYKFGAYCPFSVYPFIARDIALWVPGTAKPGDVQRVIEKNAGAFLFRIDMFDTFSKDEKTSFAFRLVFQAEDRTLTDEEVGTWMGVLTKGLERIEGWRVR